VGSRHAHQEGEDGCRHPPRGASAVSHAGAKRSVSRMGARDGLVPRTAVVHVARPVSASSAWTTMLGLLGLG
jgi:hypothetical protein